MSRKKQVYEKITALYCRISLDDGGDNESMSISNQKLMLRDFAEKHGMFQYEYYVDDGYTGRNFNRPAFQRKMCIRDRTKWRSKEHPTVSARYSKSETVKLSRFIFELKFCGVVPIRLASSATLILERTHSTLICSDMVIRVLLVKHQFFH